MDFQTMAPAEIAVRHRRNMVAMSATLLAIAAFDINVLSVGGTFVKLEGLTHHVILIILSVICIYQAISYFAFAYETVVALLIENHVKKREYKERTSDAERGRFANENQGEEKNEEIKRNHFAFAKINDRARRAAMLRLWVVDISLPALIFFGAMVVTITALLNVYSMKVKDSAVELSIEFYFAPPPADSLPITLAN